MNTYVLYHGNCYDGQGAALAAHMSDGGFVFNYRPVLHGKPMPEMEDGSVVYILDFSYSREELIKLADRMSKVVVLDHHHSAQQDLNGLVLPGQSFVAFDMNESGATMAFKYFFPKLEVPSFFQYLRDHDLWLYRLPGSKYVRNAIRSYPMSLVSFNNLFALFQTQGAERFIREGEVCTRMLEQQVAIMANNHRWVFLHGNELSTTIKFFSSQPAHTIGWSCPVANASIAFSDVVDKLLEMHPYCPFAAYYFDRKDGLRQWGLASRSDFDVSVVAKAMGGGGHKQAAGFTSKIPSL